MGGHRMSGHPITRAAAEFLKDEQRRARRAQKTRLGEVGMLQLQGALAVVGATRAPEEVASPDIQIARGAQAVGIFAYTDSFDEQAATVITDILHAAAANGASPQAVLNQAAAYYAEEASEQRKDNG